MDGIMLDGDYRVDLPDGPHVVIVRYNRVMEADPVLEHMLGLSPDQVRRWAEEQGGHMSRIGSRPGNAPSNG